MRFFLYDCHNWLLVNLKGKSQFISNHGNPSLHWNTVFGMGCWLIWKWKCKCILDNQVEVTHNPGEVIIYYAMDMHKAANKKDISICWLTWQLPREGFVN